MVHGRNVQFVLPTISSSNVGGSVKESNGRNERKKISPGTLVSRALSRPKHGVITPALKEQARSLSNMMVGSASFDLQGSLHFNRAVIDDSVMPVSSQRNTKTEISKMQQRVDTCPSTLSEASSPRNRRKPLFRNIMRSIKSPPTLSYSMQSSMQSLPLGRSVSQGQGSQIPTNSQSDPVSETFPWNKIPQTEKEAVDYMKGPWFDVAEDFSAPMTALTVFESHNFVTNQKSYAGDKVRGLVSVLIMHSNSHRVAKYGFRTLYKYSTNEDVRRMISAMGNGIPCIIKIMGLHVDVADVQKNGCALLSQIASSTTASEAFIIQNSAMPQAVERGRVSKIINAGGVDAVISAMSNHRTDVNVQLHACWAASRIGIGGGCDVVTSLISGGLIETIVDAMIQHRENVGLQFVACVVLRGLSDQDYDISDSTCAGERKENRIGQQFSDVSTISGSSVSEKYEPISTKNPMPKAMIVSGGLSAITDTMELHINEPLVMSNAMWTISVLCSYDSAIRSTFVHTNGILSIIESVQENPDEVIVEPAIKALTNITMNGRYLSATVQAGALETIVASMTSLQDNASVQEAGCCFLANLAPYTSQLIDGPSVSRAGGIGAALNAMRIHDSDPEVQSAACSCLWALAFDAPSRIRIANAGGLTAVLSAMRQHSQNATVQEKACGCISNLVITEENRAAIASAGGFDTIVVAMKTHIKNEKVQGKALRALRNVAVDSTYRVPIRCAGGLVMITRLMRIYPRNARIQEQSCDTLRFLTYDENSNVDSLLKLDGRTLLKKAADKFPNQCRSSARTIMRKLDAIKPLK